MSLFKNRYGELRGGWAVAFALAALNAAEFAAGILLSIYAVVRLVSSGRDISESAVLELTGYPDLRFAGQFIAVLLTIGASLLLFHLLYRQSPARMGLTGLRAPHAAKDLLTGCALGIAAISAAVGILLLFGGGRVTALRSEALKDPLFWLWLLLFACVALNEELFARGLLMTALKTTRSKLAILLAPAAVFACMHLSNPGFGWRSAVNLFLVGLAFAGMFARSGQLWLPIGFHLTWNFFQGNIWGLQVSGLDTPSLLVTRFTGPAWLTGGDFGAEGGMAATGVLLALLAVLWFAWPQRQDAPWRFEGVLRRKKPGEELPAEAAQEGA